MNQDNNPLNLRSQVGPAKPQVPKAEYTTSKMDRILAKIDDTESPDLNIEEPSIETPLQKIVKGRSSQAGPQQPSQQQPSQQQPSFIEEEELPLDVVSSGGQAWERFKDTQDLVRDTPRRVTDVQERVERSRAATALSRELQERQIREVREQTPSEHLLGGFKHNIFTGAYQMGLGALAIPFSVGGSIPVGLKEWYEEGSPWYLYASILKSRSWADRLIHDRSAGQDLDMADKAANFTAGVAIDVLTDPLTYFTLGASGLARVAGRGGKSVNALMDTGSRFAKRVGKANGDEVVEYVVSPYAMRQMAEKLRAGVPKEQVGKWVANKIDAGHLEYLHNGGLRFRGLGAPVSDAAGVYNLHLLGASIAATGVKSAARGVEQGLNLGLEMIGRRIPQEAISPSSPYNWLIRGVKWTQGIRPSIRYGLSSIFNKVDSVGGIVPNLQKITDLTNKNWYARQKWLGSGTEAMASFPLRYIGKKVPVIGSVWDGAADAMTQAFSPIPKHMRSLSDWAHNMNRMMSTNVIAQSDNGYGNVAIEERDRFITDHPWLSGIARRGGIVNDMLQFPIKHLAFMRRTGDVPLERVYALTNQQSGRFRGENLKATEEMQNEIINHARARATQNGTSIHDELTSMHTEILATAAIPISTSVKTLAFREASALEKVRVINNEVVELGIRKKEIEKEINTQDQLTTSLEDSERFVSLREKERVLLEKEADVRDNQLTENFEELRLTKEESDQLIELQRDIHFASELSNKSLVELEDIKDLIAKQENEYIRVLEDSKKTIEELKSLNTPSALRYLSEYRSIKDIDSQKNIFEEYYGFEQVLGDDLRTLGHVDPDMGEAQVKRGEAVQNRILNLDELVAKYETYLNTMRDRGILHTPMSEFIERIPRVLDSSARTRFSKHIRKTRAGGRGHEYLKIDRVVNRVLGEATLDEINSVNYEGRHPGYEGLGIRKEARKYKRILEGNNLLETGNPNAVYEGLYNPIVARRIAQDIYSFLSTGRGKIRDEGAVDFVNKFQPEIIDSLKEDPASFDQEFADALGIFKKIDKDYFGGIPRLENRSLFSQDIGYIQSVHGREMTRYHSAITFEREAMNRLGRTHEEIVRGDDHSKQETNARSWLDIRNFGAMGAGLGNVAFQENQALVDEDDTPLQTWAKRAIWFGLGSMGLGAGMFALRKHRSVKRQSNFINKVIQKTGTEAQWKNLTPEEQDIVTKEFHREVGIQNDYVKKAQARVVDRFFLGMDDDQFIDNKVQGAFLRSFNMLPQIDPYHVVGETNAYNVASEGITPDEMTIRVDNQDRTLEDHFFLDTLGLKSEFKQEHMTPNTLAVFNKVNEYFKNRGFENPLIKVLNQLYDRSIPLPDGEGSRQEQLSEIYFQLDRIFDQLEGGPDSFRNIVDSFNDALANSELGEGFNDFDPEFWKEMNAEGGFFTQKRELLEHIFSEHEKKLGLEDEPYALLPVGYDFARDDDGNILRTDDKYMIIETSGMKKLNALRKYHKDNAFRINKAWNDFSKRLQDDNPMFELVLKTTHGDQIRDSSGAKIGERDLHEDSIIESIVNKDGSRLTPEQAMDDNHMKNNTEKLIFSSYKDENGIIQQPHIPLSKEELQADLEYVSQFEGGVPVAGFHAKELDYDMDNPAFVSMLHHAYIQLQDKFKYTGYAETGNVSDYIRLKAYKSAMEIFSQTEDIAKRGEGTSNKKQEFDSLYNSEEERLNTQLIDDYRHLWRVWAAQNPEKLEEIRARGFGLINRNKHTRINANHYSLTLINDHFNPDIDSYKGTALTSRRPNGIESIGYHDEFVVKDPNGNTLKNDDRWSDEVYNEFNFRSPNQSTTSIMPHRMLENLLIETMPRREDSSQYFNDMIVALENGDEPTFNTSLMRLVQIGNPFKEEAWITPEGRKQTINKRLQEVSAQPSTTTYLNELGRENQTLEAVIADKMNEVFGPEWYEEQAKGNKPVFTQLNDFIRQMQWHLQPVHHPDIDDPRRAKTLQRTWSTAFKQGIATRRAWNDWQRLPNMSSSTSKARIEEHYPEDNESVRKLFNLNPEKGNLLYLETDPKSKGLTLTNAPVWDDDLKTWNIANAYKEFNVLARRANRNFGDFLNKIGDIYTQVYKFRDLDIPTVINSVHTLSDGSTLQMPEELRGPLTDAFKIFDTLKNSTGEALDKRQQAATIMGVIEMRQLFAESNVNGMDVLGKYLSRYKDNPIPARDVLAGSLNLRPLTADHMKNRNIAIISSGASGAAQGAIQVGVQNNLQMHGNMGYYDSVNSHYSEGFLQSRGLKQQQINPKQKVGIEAPFVDRDDVYVQLDSDLDEVRNVWGGEYRKGATKVSHRERNQNTPGSAPVTQEGADPQDRRFKSRQGYYDEMDHTERETLHMAYDPSATFDPTMVTPNELENTVDELYHPYTDVNAKEDDPQFTEVINFEDLSPRDKALYAARKRELHNQILANNIAQDIDKNATGGTIVFKGEDHGKRNSLGQADMSQGTTVYASLAEQSSISGTEAHPMFVVDGAFEGGNFDIMTAGELDMHKLDTLVLKIRNWVDENNIKAINISGSLENRSPRIRERTAFILNRVFNDDNINKEFSWKHGSTDDVDNFLFDIGTKRDASGNVNQRFRQRKFNPRISISDDQGNTNTRSVDNVHLVRNKGWDQELFSNPVWGKENVTIGLESMDVESNLNAANHYIRQVEKNVRIKERVFNESTPDRIIERRYDIEDGQINSNEIESIDEYKYKHHTERSSVYEIEDLSTKESLDGSTKSQFETLIIEVYKDNLTSDGFPPEVSLSDSGQVMLSAGTKPLHQLRQGNETLDQTKQRLASRLVSALIIKRDEAGNINITDTLEALSAADTKKAADILNSFLPGNTQARAYYDAAIEDQANMFYRLIEQALDNPDVSKINNRNQIEQVVDHYQRFGKFVSSPYITRNVDNPDYFINPALAITRYLNNPEKEYNGTPFVRPYTIEEKTQMFARRDGNFDTLSARVSEDLGVKWQDKGYQDEIHFETPESGITSKVIEGMHLEEAWNHIGMIIPDKDRRNKIFSQYLENIINKIPQQERALFFNGGMKNRRNEVIDREIPDEIRNDVQFLLSKVFYSGTDKAGTDPTYLHDDTIANIAIHALANIGGKTVFDSVKDKFVTLYKDDKVTKSIKLKKINQFDQFIKEVINLHISPEDMDKYSAQKSRHINLLIGNPDTQGISPEAAPLGRIAKHVPETLYDRIKTDVEPNKERQYLRNIDESLEAAYGKREGSNKAGNLDIPKTFIRRLNTGDSHLLETMIKKARDIDGNGHHDQASKILDEFISMHPERATLMLRNLYIKRVTNLPYQYVYPHSKVSPDSTLAFIESLIDVKEYVFQKDPSSTPSGTTTEVPDVGGPAGAAGAPPENIMGKFVDPNSPIGTIKHDKWEYLMRGPIDEGTADSYIDKQVVNNMADNSDASHDKVQDKIFKSQNPPDNISNEIIQDDFDTQLEQVENSDQNEIGDQVIMGEVLNKQEVEDISASFTQMEETLESINKKLDGNDSDAEAAQTVTDVFTNNDQENADNFYKTPALRDNLDKILNFNEGQHSKYKDSVEDLIYQREVEQDSLDLTNWKAGNKIKGLVESIFSLSDEEDNFTTTVTFSPVSGKNGFSRHIHPLSDQSNEGSHLEDSIYNKIFSNETVDSIKLGISFPATEPINLEFKRSTNRVTGKTKFSVHNYDTQVSGGIKPIDQGSPDHDIEGYFFRREILFTDADDILDIMSENETYDYIFGDPHTVHEELIRSEVSFEPEELSFMYAESNDSMAYIEFSSWLKPHTVKYRPASHTAEEVQVKAATDDANAMHIGDDDGNAPEEISDVAQAELDKQSATPEIPEDEFVTIFIPEKEDYARVRLDHKRPQEAMGLEKYLSENKDEYPGDNGWGWKIHIATDRSIEGNESNGKISKALQDLGITWFKAEAGWGDFQPGKDATVYVGHRDDVIAVAKYIETKLGNTGLLKKQEDVTGKDRDGNTIKSKVMSDDEQITKHIWVRFNEPEAERGPKGWHRDQYGRNGISLKYGFRASLNSRVRLGEITEAERNSAVNDDVEVQKLDLELMHGAYFTGTKGNQRHGFYSGTEVTKKAEPTIADKIREEKEARESFIATEESDLPPMATIDPKTGKELAPPESPPGYADIARELQAAEEMREATGSDPFDLPEMDKKKQTPSQEREAFIDTEAYRSMKEDQEMDKLYPITDEEREAFIALMNDDEETTGRLTDQEFEKKLDDIDEEILTNKGVSGGVDLKQPRQLPPGFIEIDGEVWGTPRTIATNDQGGSHKYQRDGKPLLLNSFHRSMVENATGIMNDDRKLSQFMKVYDFVHNFYKAYTLFPFPAYHIRNVIDSAIWRGYISGNTDMRNYVIGKHLADLKRMGSAKERSKQMKLIGKVQGLDGNEILKLAFKFGVIGESSTESLHDVTRSNMAGVDGGLHDLSSFVRNEQLTLANLEDMPKDVQESVRLLRSKKEMFGKNMHMYDGPIRSAMDKIQSKLPDWLGLKKGASKVGDFTGAVTYPMNPARALVAAKDTGIKANDYIEDSVRLSQFINQLKLNWSPELSAHYTKQVHFDYRDLSNFEQNVMRRMFSWYSFVNKNLPFNIAAQTGQFHKYAWLHHAYSNWWKSNPFVEDDQYEEGHLPRPDDMAEMQRGRLPIIVSKGKEKTYGGKDTYHVKYLKDWFSIYDLTALKPEDLKRAAWGELTPLVKAPISWWKNYDSYRNSLDNKTEFYTDETSSFLGARMRRSTVQLLRNSRVLVLADRLNPGGVFGRRHSAGSGKRDTSPAIAKLAKDNRVVNSILNTVPPFRSLLSTSPLGRRYEESGKLKALYMFDGGLGYFDPTANRKRKELYGDPDEPKHSGQKISGKFGWDVAIENAKRLHQETSDKLTSKDFDIAHDNLNDNITYMGWGLRQAKGQRTIMLQKEPWGRKNMPEYNVETVDPLLVTEKEKGVAEYTNLRDELDKAQIDYLKEQ